MSAIKKIRLKTKEERRFKSGHPWVFSNELQESPKAIELGELVELCDAGGAFLAYGFGNPNSLISFREISRDPNFSHLKDGVLAPSFFKERFSQALEFRKSWFRLNESFRMIYGEADGLSGLIIDRFVSTHSVVYVVQPHASGMEKSLELIRVALESISGSLEDQDAHLIIRRDASSREKEGLKKEAPEVLKISGEKPTELFMEKLSNYMFHVPDAFQSDLQLYSDLISGQKTGFFFDQLQNIKLLQSVVSDRLTLKPVTNYSILDLCSYVGQWGAHLDGVMGKLNVKETRYVAIDVSEKALSFVKKNVTSPQMKVETLVADVLKPLPEFLGRKFDLVIADPPAFIKSRKHIPQGKQAYIQLFQSAIEATAPGGLVIACSCSQLLSMNEFLECLGKATKRSRRTVRWLTQGSPSFDHYARLEFQEGHYLKSFIGQVG